MIVPVDSDDGLRAGHGFMPMHWGDRFLKGGVNILTQPAFDPISRQPELKHSGVRVDKVDLPWRLFVLIEGDVQRRLDALRSLCDEFPYTSLSLAGRERPALTLRAASSEAPAQELLDRIDQLLELDHGPVLAYDDPRRGISKRIRLEQGRINAIRLGGETLAKNWLQSLWLDGQQIDDNLRNWLLAPISSAPGSGASKATGSKTLCNCMNVSENTVCDAIGKGLDLGQLKAQLGCGTMCGSCVPEIKRLLTAVAIN